MMDSKQYTEVNGVSIRADYGNVLAEHAALRGAAAVLDLSARSRLCLGGTDAIRFLNGQVTNNVNDVIVGKGVYATLVNAKGKLQSDLNIYRLDAEVLLDFEPGLSERVQRRLEQFVVADDVQVVDVSSAYALFSVQGPRAAEVLQTFKWMPGLPVDSMDLIDLKDSPWGEVYVANLSRVGAGGFDCFIPTASVAAAREELTLGAEVVGGRVCGWEALEMARIEAGIPRFGADMDETNLAPEAGLESRAISYTKGCYIGQEVIARLRSVGHVNKRLCGLDLGPAHEGIPKRGDPLMSDQGAVGTLTSVTWSPTRGRVIALGYVRRDWARSGQLLSVQSVGMTTRAEVVDLPFVSEVSRA